MFEKSHVMINIHDTERVSAGNETEINYKVQYWKSNSAQSIEGYFN